MLIANATAGLHPDPHNPEPDQTATKRRPPTPYRPGRA
jgi:hypothetical protein